MKLGAEPKKVAILGVLVALAGYLFYSNLFSGGDAAPRPAPKTMVLDTGPAVTGARPAAKTPPPNIRRASRPVRGAGAEEFRPTLARRADDNTDYTTLDPTLKLDLLAKVQSVPPEGGTRSLFQFGAPAPPPKPVAEAPKIEVARKRFGPDPAPPPPPPPAKPPEPPPPPITLKFFGYSKPRPDGKRNAFFLDGEEVYVAAEGELVKKRYRVVRIDVNSVVMEDTEHKNHRQTLVLQPEQQG
jgi:hypothetical protein